MEKKNFNANVWKLIQCRIILEKKCKNFYQLPFCYNLPGDCLLNGDINVEPCGFTASFNSHHILRHQRTNVHVVKLIPSVIFDPSYQGFVKKALMQHIYATIALMHFQCWYLLCFLPHYQASRGVLLSKYYDCTLDDTTQVFKQAQEALEMRSYLC